MVLVGDFIGDVTDVSLEVVTSAKTGKDWPLFKVKFSVHKGLKGTAWVDLPNVRCEKAWFLSTEVAKSGKFAGKTSLEILAINLKDAFGYEGGLDLDQLKEGLMGKSARLVCEAKDTGKGEKTEVKWVNNVNGTGTYVPKAIPANLLNALSKQFGGKKNEASAESLWGKT